MKITALVENTTNKDWPTEHGLSLYIETAKHKILMDCGQSNLFAKNAKELGINLADVDICVLSHGHYDHGGGLRTFLDVNDHAPIYMSNEAFGLHYHGDSRYIGLNRDWLKDCEFTERIVYVDGDMEIDDELKLCSPNGKEKSVDMGYGGLYEIKDGRFVPEEFNHEHYLLVNEDGKKVLFSGCSHQGILNIMEWFKPNVLVGGFHFMKKPLDDKLEQYAKTLSEYDTDYYTCHCTGCEQYQYMKPHIARMNYLAEGDEVLI